MLSDYHGLTANTQTSVGNICGFSWRSNLRFLYGLKKIDDKYNRMSTSSFASYRVNNTTQRGVCTIVHCITGLTGATCLGQRGITPLFVILCICSPCHTQDGIGPPGSNHNRGWCKCVTSAPTSRGIPRTLRLVAQMHQKWN